ncbi:MAG: GDSL-type esterase/lipase family protein [Luteolibacter sp.]
MKTLPTAAISLVVSLFFAHALNADALKPIDPADYKGEVKVACVGDSITQGAGAEKGKSYPSQLQRMLGDGWKVFNFGKSGRTLMKKGDHPYWKEKVYQQALGSKPDVVIIMLGTNDSKPQNWVYKAEFEADYRELVDSFQKLESKPRIYICRPCPVFGKNYKISEAPVQEEIVIIDKLAAEMNIGLIDMHAALEDFPKLLPDGVHPNTEGAGKMAAAAFTALTGKEAKAE